MLGTVAHEFFHAWNMERIRSRDLEPFNFEEADVSGELWFGEGFTSYYDDLIMRRTGLTPLEDTLASFAGTINAVTHSPGRQFRSAEDMSPHRAVRRRRRLPSTARAGTTPSSRTTRSARRSGWRWICRCATCRTAGRRSTRYMQALWARFGRPGQKVPGMVATPYTMDDLKNVLGEVSGDRQVRRHLLQPSSSRAATSSTTRRCSSGPGWSCASAMPGRAYLGGPGLNFQGGGGARVPARSPSARALYKAGVDRDDLIVVASTAST